MKRLLFAPLAIAALLFSTQAATAAPRAPRHHGPRWEARHRPDAYRYHHGEPLPTHRVARLPRPLPPAPERLPFR